MPIPRFEVPSGTIDGVNTVFNVSAPYQPGTTAVYLNGLLQEPSLDDGWTETDPLTGEVTLKEAPKSLGACPDVLQVFFLDTSPQLPESVIDRIKGRLSAVGDLKGSLTLTSPLAGLVEASGTLQGAFMASTQLKGLVEPAGALKGRLESC